MANPKRIPLRPTIDGSFERRENERSTRVFCRSPRHGSGMPSFRTKRGRCHVEDGRLRLESSLRGQMRRYREGSRLLYWSFLVVIVVAIGYPVVLVATGEYRTVLFWGGGVALVLGGGYALNRWRGFTSEDEIPLDAVTHVTANEGRKGLTRPRFVVTYVADGETKRRYVMMPSKFLSYGDDEFERATACFREAGLPVEKR